MCSLPLKEDQQGYFFSGQTLLSSNINSQKNLLFRYRLFEWYCIVASGSVAEEEEVWLSKTQRYLSGLDGSLNSEFGLI